MYYSAIVGGGIRGGFRSHDIRQLECRAVKMPEMGQLDVQAADLSVYLLHGLTAVVAHTERDIVQRFKS